jgi:hypothetical protein
MDCGTRCFASAPLGGRSDGIANISANGPRKECGYRAGAPVEAQWQSAGLAAKAKIAADSNAINAGGEPQAVESPRAAA